MLIETITNGPFVENCYLIADEQTRDALLIDPGDEEQRILERIRELNLRVKEIVCTHGHIDHVGAVAPLKRLLGVPFAIHPAEQAWLDHLSAQASMFGLQPKEIPSVDRHLTDGELLQVGQLTLRVAHTPGHSAGGCSLISAEQQVAFVGDTLFAGSVGRTDLPGGNPETLLRSIHEQLLTLDDDVTVYSGHGPTTTIGTERHGNPFLR